MARTKGQRLRVYGSFLVAAYRRPDFRVDVTLNAPTTIAGTKLTGTISAQYLFGAPMSARPVRWTYSKYPAYAVPAAIRDRYPEDQFTFLGRDYDENLGSQTIAKKDGKVNAKGLLSLDLGTDLKAGWPWTYTLEGDVTDVSR
ncbi:MAG: hypothetical protein DMF59_04450, partial [Acidobacteria bacterium]